MLEPPLNKLAFHGCCNEIIKNINAILIVTGIWTVGCVYICWSALLDCHVKTIPYHNNIYFLFSIWTWWISLIFVFLWCWWSWSPWMLMEIAFAWMLDFGIISDLFRSSADGPHFISHLVNILSDKHLYESEQGACSCPRIQCGRLYSASSHPWEHWKMQLKFFAECSWRLGWPAILLLSFWNTSLKCPSHDINCHTCTQHDITGELNLATCLRQCLPGFPIVKLSPHSLPIHYSNPSEGVDRGQRKLRSNS